ncbi:peptidylprolyl isomerase [Notoacmeibacter sp. MSK16QG-6]|uniref:peptidylprolyl isomerase n=1 Tax=Notoacmeibacter sp. MSK16QG-6 TaxID=2957982 RepID=UPI00209E21D9|nr:peptidylprolyl isomerase [Notoacmeibacter sp. MSK16QG-6]MCP1199951.1 peptidylprolyl isomerase [Notoacmeibacter sp. MSK16QG-6]
MISLRPARILLAGVVLAASVTIPAFAQEENETVATVNGSPITRQELDMAMGELGPQFARIPEDKRDAAALAALIEIKLMSGKAREAGLDKDEEFQRSIAFMTERALHGFYMQKQLADEITDGDVKALYDERVADMPKQQEVKARHILVKTKEDAEAVIAELEGGADFEAVAKEKSTGPSGPSGGDLGYFRPGQMVPEFEQAAFALETGSITKEPVQTQFGFHVIKVEDKRNVKPPEFEQIKDQLRNELLVKRYTDAVKTERSEATVEISDPALQTELKALEATKEAE